MKRIGNEVRSEDVLRKMQASHLTGTVLNFLILLWNVICLLDLVTYVVGGPYFAGRFIVHLPWWHF